ncbi:hypothetical protein BAE44_0019647 [Dichanthelium oligosanthes]|uniref:Wall-associated receptor kinase galacturonan-binding domain-containing protein n=1 Tax=Dichanthelium oligosanthes TaxID=888268 RepID=A0A1E5V2R4_9POAL|nr:hypothetical protein BAE44_0019647 [Dichanthelium oligosanthes]
MPSASSSNVESPLGIRKKLSVQVADARGQNQCPPFSCGGLHNVSYPFRRPRDPPECGVQSYELTCSSSKATIRINTGTYFVTSINYTDRSFWVVDANLDMHSSCPLPRWDQFPYNNDGVLRSGGSDPSACFVNCSQAITNISWYKPVPCLTGNGSFVYVSILNCVVQTLDPSCGYLAMILLSNLNAPQSHPLTLPNLLPSRHSDRPGKGSAPTRRCR